MPEGDSIYRAARAIEATLGDKEIVRAEAPDRRSPLHGRLAGLPGLLVEGVEPRGKHLLIHLSGGVVVHSHLGISGRWRNSSRGAPSPQRSWLLLAAADGTWVAQSGGKLLRLTTTSRVRRDPALLRLGPDPLDPAFDPDAAAVRLLAADPSREVGEALLDQSLIAGLGNVLRLEACFASGISPWRRVGDLSDTEADALIDAAAEQMRISIERGRRPTAIYRRPPQPCPRCGGRVRSRGQGDDNRTAYWCESCQR